MSDLFSRRTGRACPSDLALDRLLAGEPDASAERHLAGCDRCRTRLEELRAAQAAFFAGVDVTARVDAMRVAAAAARAAAPPPHRWWTRLVPPLLAAATTAAIVLLLVRDRDEAAPDVVRLKGGAESLEVLQRGPEAAAFELVAADDRLAPGTELGFRLHCRDRCAVVLAGVSEHGEPYVIDATLTLAPGAPRTAPFTVELDEAPGAERFYALFCSRHPEAGAVIRALAAAHPRQGDRRAIERAARPAVSGCALASQLVRRP